MICYYAIEHMKTEAHRGKSTYLNEIKVIRVKEIFHKEEGKVTMTEALYSYKPLLRLRIDD